MYRNWLPGPKPTSVGVLAGSPATAVPAAASTSVSPTGGSDDDEDVTTAIQLPSPETVAPSTSNQRSPTPNVTEPRLAGSRNQSWVTQPALPAGIWLYVISRVPDATNVTARVSDSRSMGSFGFTGGTQSRAGVSNLSTRVGPTTSVWPSGEKANAPCA